jgi:hypothetical protein
MLTLVWLGCLATSHHPHAGGAMTSAPRTATVPVKRDGEMVIIPVAELVPGDVTLGRFFYGERGHHLQGHQFVDRNLPDPRKTLP